MEQPSSDRPSLRTILVMLVLALAVLLAALSSGFWVTTTHRLVVPTTTHRPVVPAPMHAEDATPMPDPAENGSKQCVGPREIEGPSCS